MAGFLKLLFIGISLNTYYFYNFRMPLISVVCLFIMTGILFGLSLEKFVRLPKNASVGVALGYVLILSWSIIGLLFYLDSPDAKRFISFPILTMAALVAGVLFRRIPLENLVRLYLVVHVSFFFLQFVTYFATGYVIDYLAPVTGEEQRMFGGSFTFPIVDRFIRSAGLFNEPGTYVTYIAPFVALLDRWYEKSEANKQLFWISLFSMFLSFSAFGIVFGVLILLFCGSLRRIHRIFVFIACSALVQPFLYYRFVLRPSLGLDTGLEFRQVFIDESFGFLLSNPIGIVFGSNLLVLDPRAEFSGSFNDSSLLLYFLHFAGPLLTLLFGAVFMYAFIKFDRASRVALLILLLSKFSVFAPFFPFVLVAIFWKPPLPGKMTDLQPYQSHPPGGLMEQSNASLQRAGQS